MSEICTSTREKVRTSYEVLVSNHLVKKFKGFAEKVLVKWFLWETSRENMKRIQPSEYSGGILNFMF
jgi:hypothetical protein